MTTGLRFRPVGIVDVAPAEDFDARCFEEPRLDLGRSATKVA